MRNIATTSTVRARAALAAALLASCFLLAPSAARAHATYNLSGYGAGIPGSVGNDGSVANPPLSWTNGAPEGYAGSLPVMWYCGLHALPQARTIQTGAGASPPAGSVLAQVNAYNAATDPDLPVDRVLAVGGLSWSDPANGDQGWGHGLDYGLIHLSPLEEITAAGRVKLTVTLTDDPTDAVSPRLAFALYGGWDTSTNALRHQTFVTSPSPVDNPLGSAGLTLIDFAVASSAGGALTRTYDVDPVYEGRYTLFVAALGGVSGQYQMTASVVAGDAALDQELGECRTDLADARASLDTATKDTDADTVPDQRDACPTTPPGQLVDVAGCSQAEFCAALPVATKAGRKACEKADWENDEPAMKAKQADCGYAKQSKTCVAR